MAKRRLGDLLVEMGFLTPSKLEVALKEQRRTGELLGQTLERLGFVSPEKMALVLAAQAGIPFVNLKETKPKPEAIEALSEDLAREYHVLPIELKGNTLVVATDNPYDVLEVDRLKERSGRDIEIRVAEPELITSLIDEYYGVKGVTDKDLEAAVQEVLSSLGSETMESPLIGFVEKLIGNALVAMTFLGTGLGSRVYHRLREELSLAYMVGGQVMAARLLYTLNSPISGNAMCSRRPNPSTVKRKPPGPCSISRARTSPRSMP